MKTCAAALLGLFLFLGGCASPRTEYWHITVDERRNPAPQAEAPPEPAPVVTSQPVLSPSNYPVVNSYDLHRD